MRPSEADDPVRLAIVGCGAAAERCHVAGLPYVPEVSLVAVVDPVPDNANRLVDAFAAAGGDTAGIFRATSVSELAGRVDAAVVATPHRYHAPTTLELLDAGIHCLIEKPMALTTDECDEIESAARVAGRVVGVAHVRRLFPASRWLRGELGRGRFGEVTSIRWLEGAPYDWPLVSPSLFSVALAGGGVLADSGPHVLDLLLWWLDAPEAEVVGYRDSSRGGAESEAVLELVAAGVPIEVELSRLRLLANTCVVAASEATVEIGIDVEAPFTVEWRDGREPERGIVRAVAPAQTEWERLFSEQLRNFALAVRGREAIYAGPADGRRTVAVIRECYERRETLPRPWNELRPL